MDFDRIDIPWEGVPAASSPAAKRPGLLVDLRRCIGCHACSVGCKTANQVPLGEFRMRVRYLQRPDRDSLAFLPLFDARRCDFGASRTSFGLDPACVSACPTDALRFGDLDDPTSEVAKRAVALDAKPLDLGVETKADVLYIGQEPWFTEHTNAGVALSAADEDIIYEQR